MVSLSVTLAYPCFLTKEDSFFRRCLESGKLLSIVEALQLKIDMRLKDYVTLNMSPNNIPVHTLGSTKIPQTLYF